MTRRTSPRTLVDRLRRHDHEPCVRCVVSNAVWKVEPLRHSHVSRRIVLQPWSVGLSWAHALGRSWRFTSLMGRGLLVWLTTRAIAMRLHSTVAPRNGELR